MSTNPTSGSDTPNQREVSPCAENTLTLIPEQCIGVRGRVPPPVSLPNYTVVHRAIKIPTYAQSRHAAQKGMATPLEQFVHDNEPAGLEQEAVFRSGLQAILDWIWEGAP